jgi:hypothetical protein
MPFEVELRTCHRYSNPIDPQALECDVHPLGITAKRHFDTVAPSSGRSPEEKFSAVEMASLVKVVELLSLH